MKKLVALLLMWMVLVSVPVLGEGISGTVSTDGSTSMERVIGALGESFTLVNPAVKVTYNPTGSSSGITAVAEGRTDMGLSSRALKDAEKAQSLQETVLCLDAIALVVHQDNPVTDLTLAQIAQVFAGEITNWNALGGHDAPNVVIGREAGSGTRDGFESIVGVKDGAVYGQELNSTGDVLATVAGNPNAIGYVSLATVKPTVHTLNVNGVAPTAETVQDGTYPVFRPFVLVTRTDTALSPAAQAFFDYTATDAAREIITAVGLIPNAQ